MAEVDHSFGEPEIAHESEIGHETEIAHEAEIIHEAEIANEPEISHLPEIDQVSENSEVPIQEHLQIEEKQEHDEDTAVGGGEKKWPGWPGESVFRMLVPAQKVGSIIGRKGEFIKKIVEETRARIKILDGPPGTAERAVSLKILFIAQFIPQCKIC